MKTINLFLFFILLLIILIMFMLRMNYPRIAGYRCAGDRSNKFTPYVRTDCMSVPIYTSN